MIDPGELALANVGLSPVIKRETPVFGVERMRAAQAIPKDIEAAARKLVTEPPSMPKLGRPHAYRALLTQLSKPLTPQEGAAIQERFRPPAEPLGGPFWVKVQQAFEHVRKLFPVANYGSFAGQTPLEPTADKVWRFFLELQVLDDPMLVVPLAAGGGLLPAQVAAVRELYPGISDAIDAAIYQALSVRRAEKQSFRLSPRTEYGLAVWFGRRTVDYQPPAPAPAPGGDLSPQPASQVAKAQVSPAEDAGQITPQQVTP